MPERFDFAFVPAYRRAAAPFGIRPANAWVEVTETELDARFGLWGLRTPLMNIAAAEVTGPYGFIKTAGPARLGVTDAGLTFATNGDRGVLVTFREKVRSSGPTRLLRHPELTVTVAEPERLAALLNSSPTNHAEQRGQQRPDA